MIEQYKNVSFTTTTQSNYKPHSQQVESTNQLSKFIQQLLKKPQTRAKLQVNTTTNSNRSTQQKQMQQPISKFHQTYIEQWKTVKQQNSQNYNDENETIIFDRLSASAMASHRFSSQICRRRLLTQKLQVNDKNYQLNLSLDNKKQSMDNIVQDAQLTNPIYGSKYIDYKDTLKYHKLSKNINIDEAQQTMEYVKAFTQQQIITPIAKSFNRIINTNQSDYQDIDGVYWVKPNRPQSTQISRTSKTLKQYKQQTKQALRNNYITI